MATLARRTCVNTEAGCDWKTPQCDQITTVAEALETMRLHASGCLFNPRRMEERQYQRQAEAAEISQRKAEMARRMAADLRRFATEAEERREQRDDLRQQEAARVAAERAADYRRAPTHNPPTRPVAGGRRPVAPRQQEWRQFADYQDDLQKMGVNLSRGGEITFTKEEITEDILNQGDLQTMDANLTFAEEEITECVFNPRVMEERQEAGDGRWQVAGGRKRGRRQEVARVTAETAAVNQRAPNASYSVTQQVPWDLKAKCAPIHNPPQRPPRPPKSAPMPRPARKRKRSQQEWRQVAELHDEPQIMGISFTFATPPRPPKKRKRSQ